LVPEFDMPGHSGGFCHGLKQSGIVCCDNGGMGVPQVDASPLIDAASQLEWIYSSARPL
jgi:hypothetical protein